MISKLEAYCIIGLLLAVAAAFFAGDLHGHLAEARDVRGKQTEADAKALGDAVKQLQTLASGDQTAADNAAKKLTGLNKGIDDAVAKLGRLPSVVVDARGCEHLSGDWGLRWNTVESLPGGSPLGVPVGADGSVPAGGVQPPR